MSIMIIGAAPVLLAILVAIERFPEPKRQAHLKDMSKKPAR